MKKLRYRENNILIIRSDDLHVKDIYKIGKYEWKILDICNHKALIISNSIIDERKINYNNDKDYEHSELNDWFKNGFIPFSFEWDFVPLISSEVFLLSKKDIEIYLDSYVIKNNKGYASSYYLSDYKNHKVSYVDFLGI